MSWVSDFSSVMLELGAHREHSTRETPAWNQDACERMKRQREVMEREALGTSALSVQTPSATAWVASHTRQEAGVRWAKLEGTESHLGEPSCKLGSHPSLPTAPCKISTASTPAAPSEHSWRAWDK